MADNCYQSSGGDCSLKCMYQPYFLITPVGNKDRNDAGSPSYRLDDQKRPSIENKKRPTIVNQNRPTIVSKETYYSYRLMVDRVMQRCSVG